MKRYLQVGLVSVALMAFSLIVQGQPGGGGPGGGGEPLPISGLEWLLIGGGIFGARKFYQRFKERS